jgi:hypothetical protein
MASRGTPGSFSLDDPKPGFSWRIDRAIVVLAEISFISSLLNNRSLFLSSWMKEPSISSFSNIKYCHANRSVYRLFFQF